MSEAEVINYMRQICEGVKHMHERNIIHLGKQKLLGVMHLQVIQTGFLKKYPICRSDLKARYSKERILYYNIY